MVKTGFSLLLESAGADFAQLDIAGSSFGMTDSDFLLLDEEGESLLEVVLSRPIQKDVTELEEV